MKKLILIFSLISIYNLYALNIVVNGNASYYDVDLNTRKPIVNALIRLETLNPTVLINGSYPTTYTDSNGNYQFNIGSNYPAQVTVRIFFKNQKIDLRGYETTHSEIMIMMKYINPPPWHIIGSEFSGMDFEFQENEMNNKYSKVFMMGNTAVNFAELNGYYPDQAIIKYPAEESLFSEIEVETDASFFWPFGNYTINELNVALVSPFYATVFALMGLEAQLTSNTIYLERSEANQGNRTTVFHEYGHFLMKKLRGGSWPINLSEYLSGDESPAHSWNDYNQSEKLSWVEGWANYWGSAVESWYSGSPYQGKYEYYYSLFEYPQYVNDQNFSFSSVTDGYKNEITVGSALFDFYDTSNYGDADGLQIAISVLFNLIGNDDNKFADYVESLYATLSQTKRISLENVLDINKMELLIPLPQVYISGPTSLGYNVQGTFTANPSGGSGTYINYRWWERKDEGGGPESIDSESIIDAPPPGQWIDCPWTTQTIQISRTWDFSLKCEVTDSYGTKAEDIHSVSVGGALAKAVNYTEIQDDLVPDKITLFSNYPNPFNPTTTIKFGLPEDSHVDITIYSSTGQKILTIVDGLYSKGYHEVIWSGKNQAGNSVSNGIYIYELRAGNHRLIKKMVFAK